MSVSSCMLSWRFAVHYNCSLLELVCLVIERTKVAYLKSFPWVVVKKTFRVTCEVFRSRKWLWSYFVDDFTICPIHRLNLGVGWSRGSNRRCWVPKEVPGHGKGRVKSIPKADGGIGKRVSQIALKTSGKFIQPGSGKKATYHFEQNTHGCPQSKNTTTGKPCDSGPPREQITEWTARIEMHQSELLNNN